MKYTVFSNDGKEYIMHNGVKIHRTTIMPDVYRFNCSLCSYSGANQYNVIRHINTRHKDYVTDNAVNNEMEGGKMTDEEKEARKYQEEKRKREKELAKEEAKRKRQEKIEAEKEEKRQQAIVFDNAREARREKIAKRKALKAQLEQGIQHLVDKRKAQDEASKEMKNQIQEDVTQRDLVDVLRMDTIQDAPPSPESGIMKNDTIPPPTTPDENYSMKFEKNSPTKTKKEPEYSMVFEETEPTKQNITIEPEIVEEDLEPAVEESPTPVFQKEDVNAMLKNVGEMKDTQCKNELQKIEKRYKNKIDKVNKEKKGNDCKKELEKLKKEFKTEIKDTIEGMKSGIVKINDDDMKELIENANKFADSMINFAKRSENEKNKKEVEKMTGKKGGTRKKRRPLKNTHVPGAQYVWTASTQNAKDKPRNKTSNKVHKRKTKVNKKTRHNKTPANKKPIVRLDSAKLKNLSRKSRIREIMKQTSKNKK
jgi:hypothetical protein